MKKPKRKIDRIIIYIIVSISVMALIGVAVFFCALKIESEMTNQLKQNLEDVTVQNAESLSTQVEAKYDLLKSMALRFELEPDKREENLYMFIPVAEAFGLKRMGYVNENGIAYATDASGVDLSYRDFYIKGMKGRSCISSIMRDAMSEEHEEIVIMSMPIYDLNNHINGVAAITYDVSNLSDELGVKSFDGNGDTFYINGENQVVVSSNEKLTPFINIECEGFPSEGNISLGDEKYMYKIVPVNLMNDKERWYVLTVVPEKYIMSRMNIVRYHLARMICLVLGIILVGVFTVRVMYRKQRILTYELAYQSQTTGGPNLVNFFMTLGKIKALKGYLIAMNIENFAHIGFAAGAGGSQELLRAIWKKIDEELKTGEYAAHDKDDNFVLFLKDADKAELTERIKRLQDNIYRQSLDNGMHWVTPRFGIYEITEDESVGESYSKAQFAVAGASKEDTGIAFYDDEARREQMFKASLSERFRGALERNEFDVYYQPKYSASNNELLGCEALVRWKLPDGTMIPPNVFISLLEQNGEIWRLDEYVFRFVCNLQKRWQENGFKTVPASVNLSRATLYREGIVEKYLTIIKEYGIEPSDIQLEITESAVGGNSNIAGLLNTFRENGIKILMDDFGTGYSSLATLNQKCFDTIKIDKSLVDNLEDPYGRIIMKNIVQMCKSLGLHITVEGVETQAQLDILQELECDDIQGFFYSRPLPCSDFEKWLS